MKQLFTLFLFLLSYPLIAQTNISVLSGYKHILLLPLTYQDGTSDRWGIRKQVKDQLVLSGFQVIDGDKVPDSIPDQCLVAICSIEHTNNGYSAVSDYVYLKLYNCQKENIYSSQGASGALVMSVQSGWRTATREALSGFKTYAYKFNPTATVEANMLRNMPSVESVKIDEDSLKRSWALQSHEPLEGIYKSMQSESMPYYKIAIQKRGGKLIGAILETDSKAWKIGEIKAYFEPTASADLYSVKWLMGNKTSEETFAMIKESALLSIDLKDMETGKNRPSLFIKTFPTNTAEVKTSEDYNPNRVKATGSGFFITSDGVIATNYHVVSDSKKIEVVLSEDNGKSTTYEASVIIQDKINDIALLKIKEPTFSMVKPVPYKIVDKTNVGESVFTIGYPLSSIMGTNYKVSNGIVSAQSGIDDDIRFLQVTVPIQPGNSGGPLFNKDGDVIGITSSRLNGKAIGVGVENVNYAIKASYLMSLYSMTKDPTKLTLLSKIPSKTLESQVKQLKSFVCLIKTY